MIFPGFLLKNDDVSLAVSSRLGLFLSRFGLFLSRFSVTRLLQKRSDLNKTLQVCYLNDEFCTKNDEFV